MSQAFSCWIHLSGGQIGKHLVAQRVCSMAPHLCVACMGTHTQMTQESTRQLYQTAISSKRVCHFSSGRIGGKGGGSAIAPLSELLEESRLATRYNTCIGQLEERISPLSELYCKGKCILKLCTSFVNSSCILQTAFASPIQRK